MAFTGKATYSAGATLPELAEDVADLNFERFFCPATAFTAET